MRKPKFKNLLKVLSRECPDRPTLFEFFLNSKLHDTLAPDRSVWEGDIGTYRGIMTSFHNAGYDYATINTGFSFPKAERHRESTLSLNEGALITDRKSFDNYEWPDPQEADYSVFEDLVKYMPAGMKLVACGPGGVLENVTQLVGYDNLCFMSIDDPALLEDIVESVGSRMVEHYRIIGQYPSVGAMISNDDWGFKTQTMLSPEDMRRYIVPWHKRIAETIHASGRPAILHSCGNLETLMDDIIDTCGYDGKHSYEDTIIPVEEAYEKWSGRIAILGGIDLDFICRNDPEQVKKRCRKMLERAEGRGAYALGSGNSIPEYVPCENYMAMISVVNE